MGDEQFEITDGRSFDQMYADIKNMASSPLPASIFICNTYLISTIKYLYRTTTKAGQDLIHPDLLLS